MLLVVLLLVSLSLAHNKDHHNRHERRNKEKEHENRQGKGREGSVKGTFISLPDYPPSDGSLLVETSLFPHIGQLDFTFSAIITADKWADGMIFTKERKGGAPPFRVQMVDKGQLVFIGLGVNAKEFRSPPLNLTVPYVFTFVRNHDGLSFYFNGSLVTTKRSAIVAHRDEGLNFRVGSRYPRDGSSADTPFLGTITHTRLYDYALNPSEIVDLFHSFSDNMGDYTPIIEPSSSSETESESKSESVDSKNEIGEHSEETHVCWMALLIKFLSNFMYIIL